MRYYFSLPDTKPSNSIPLSLRREHKLRLLMNGMSTYIDWIPPREDCPLVSARPEYCYTGWPIKDGKEYTIWVYFKENLSIEILKIYFDEVTWDYIFNFVAVLLSFYFDIVEGVEIYEISPKRCIGIDNLNTTNH